MNYRLTGSLTMLALYRCAHCGRVALHPVSLKKRTHYESTWTKSGLERRRKRKQEALSRKLNKAADALSGDVRPVTFIGKTIDGKCPHCGKRQPWMRMSYSLWGSLVCVLAFFSAVGAFCVYTYEGSWRQLQTMQTALLAMVAGLIIAAAALVVHAVIMLSITGRSLREGPVFLVRSKEELLSKAAGQTDYIKELNADGNQT